MKSVCLVVQNIYDIDPRVRRKAEALVAAGYSVDVMALRASRGESRYSLNGVNVHTITLDKKRGSLARYFLEYAIFFTWVFVRVPLQMRRRRYGVINVNTLPDFLIFAPVLAKWMGAKLLLDMHEITPEFFMSKYRITENCLRVRVLKYLEKISFNFADHVLTINQPIEDLLVGRGLARAKSTIVMNVADETRFAGMSVLHLKKDPGKFVMMYHGTLTHIYGLDIAIEAFALVHKEMPDAELWILGSGPEEQALSDLVKKHRLDSKVRLVGRVPPTDIPEWLSQCDIGILPIRRDVFLDFAFPNKLPEFIIMGKAVIVSRLKAIRRYFSADALAYCEPNDPVDLSRQMVRTFRDSQLRTRLALKAKSELAPIRWPVMKKRYLELIARMIDPTGRGENSRLTDNQTGSGDACTYSVELEGAAREL